MNKKISLFLVLVLALSLLMAGCGSKEPAAEDTGKVYEVKISHLASATDQINLGFMKFKELVEAKSNGKIKVTIFHSKQISNSDRENAEKVQQNIVQMGSVPTFTLAALADINEYQVFDYPFLFKNDADIYKVMDGQVGADLGKMLMQKTGIKAYGTYSLGWVKIASNKKSISIPDDIKGAKIRTTNSELYMELVKSLGGSPTPMAYGEVFTGLQQGVVDGMMTTTGLFVSDRFYEVVKYMADVNPFSIVHVIIVNNSFYESLPADLKVVWDESMKEYTAYIRQIEDQGEKDAIKTLKEKGMQVTELTPEQKKAFVDLGAPIVDNKADLVGKEFLDKVRKALVQ